MSSKSAAENSRMPAKALASDRRSLSLAVRLTLWYAASAFVLLLVGTGFLYSALVDGLNSEDDHDLGERIADICRLVKKSSCHSMALKNEVEIKPGDEPVLVRVLQPDGLILAETSGMSLKVPPTAFPDAPPLDSPASRGTRLTVPDQRPFRGMTLRVAIKAGSCVIQAAVDQQDNQRIISRYRRRMLIVLGVGLFVCAFIGYGVARQGMRPVNDMATAMQHIRATTLHERIHMASLPAELRMMGDTFNEMLDRLEESFDRLSRFSADIAHELRSPINNLRGEAEVALSKPRSGDEYRDVLGSCLEECLRLTSLIDRLLFLARSEDPKTQIQRESLQVFHELEVLRDFYEASARDAGVTLRIESAQGIEAMADRALFQQAVGNLIENALAHTARGGTITMKAIREETALCVTVADTGCGIPAGEIPKIFERFHRGDQSRSGHTGRYGLGLAIVKSISALHGGSVFVESQVGVGTCVGIRFHC